jgi:hypothetical protein
MIGLSINLTLPLIPLYCMRVSHDLKLYFEYSLNIKYLNIPQTNAIFNKKVRYNK